MRAAARLLVAGASVVCLAGGLLLAGALSPAPRHEEAATQTVLPPADPVMAGIRAAQDRLARLPNDERTWAELSLLYVAQAKASGNPAYYDKARGAAGRSLEISPSGNDVGHAAVAALDNAEHRFHAALTAARAGLEDNPYSSTLHGALADALTQLGRYDEAASAVERMNELQPGVPAFTRTSYALELRGDVTSARAALMRALAVASNPADKAFARTYLGELALAYQGGYGGSARVALSQVEEGLRLLPRDHALRDARARALAGLGRTTQAVADYRELVGEVPLPQYVLEYGELLQSLGRGVEASRQFALFRTEEGLLRARGVTLDVEPALFEADHGSPTRALSLARGAWRERPFLETADAYAWALYRNGRYAEALRWSDRALATGWPNALAHFHRGMVERALGRTADAEADLARCLALNPGFSRLHAPSARAALDQLRGGHT